LFKTIRWILLVYVLLCGLYYTYQHLFFFQPKELDKKHVFNFPAQAKFTTAKIPFDTATVIDVVKFQPQDSVSKGVVLFFHGNRYNVERYSNYAPFFTKQGYECWMPDYPGYGRSTGEIDIDILQKLSIQLYKMARVKYAPNQIVIYGKSLGTGIGTYLASQRDCRHLLLETPYHSLSSLAGNYAFILPVDWLTKYNLDTKEYLKNVTAPVTVIHGTDDALIPLHNAVKLAVVLKPKDAFYIIPDGQHNSLSKFPLYQHVIDSVMTK
jgi:pimeloyl-ACP methyl ester carboxylesterase